jgi:deaminated glutathione amidase
MFLAAAIQLSCTSNAENNLRTAEQLIARAAAYGASLVCTPENTNYLGPHQDKVRLAEPLSGPTVSRLAELAAKHGIHLLIGSVNERSDEDSRCYNTSVLLSPTGELMGSYRKIHLFDVDAGPGVCFKESDTVIPGDLPVVVDTVLGRIGLSICYDLRFPELYRRLTELGAEIVNIPAAFTLTTGKDHWHPLMRARAIETQTYVIAAGQSGHHDDEGLRHSYGHSMIVDPWGHVVGMSSDGPGIALAEVDLERVATVRRGMPVAQHRRF